MSSTTDIERQPLVGGGVTDGSEDGFLRFCNRLGIEPSTRTTGPRAMNPSIYRDVLEKRMEYRVFHILLLTIAIIAVISQIALGIIISSLSGINAAKYSVAIIILGAFNSFIGFVSAWIQYQGQPARANQFFSALDDVRTEILASHGALKNKGKPEDGDVDAIRIRDMYKQAVHDALANQPAVWSSGGNIPALRGPPGSDGKTSTSDRIDNLFDGDSHEPNRPRRTGDTTLTPKPLQANGGGS